ncbi:fatty acid hydroxylase family protein [Stylonychia lemnae]|uniref:Fatty acid 2-hydroxylase n=1 Tax=Stylonychia lemnae TaxID=5949 RepID=A0A077ZP78_STYLE|nr:fatty acid hydroxylase family protein [Stylonychia lemnae]|eukprot:CDW71718.1 fatty acid hydroxylase family protein [Stylonychia lemnae]
MVKQDKTIQFNSIEEVQNLGESDKNLKLIVFGKKVFNINSYIEIHPGGSQILEQYLNCEIDEPFNETGHTVQAKQLFNEIPLIGFLKNEPQNSIQQHDSKIPANEAKDFRLNREIEGLNGYVITRKQWNPDYEKGLIWQLWKAELSIDQYLAFIEEPKALLNRKGHIKMYDNKLLQLGVQVHWSHAIFGWLSLILYNVWQAQLSITDQVLSLIFGFMIWTITEYCLHRFVFHFEKIWAPPTRVFQIFNFITHGMHHAFPNETYGVITPVLPAMLFAISIIDPQARRIIPEEYAGIVLAGFYLGFLTYDLVHHFLHHSSPQNNYFRNLKIYHMQHHYKNGNAGYGVICKFWDKVFQTELKK